MPNTCSICKHQEREAIEGALACGMSFRDIAPHFGASKDAVSRHQACIAKELQAYRTQRSERLNDSLLTRLNHYRTVAESFLKDDEKALMALDRCYKQVDIEAKLTGAYQEKRENEHDAVKNREILIQAFSMIYERTGEPKTREEIEYIMDESDRALKSVYQEAKAIVEARGWVC